jgi:hypothetical protein
MNSQSLQTVRARFNLFASWGNVLTTLILLSGVLLRIRQYLTGRSLWADEAMLALNVVHRDFGDLLKPLDYDQGAPIGFILVEKTFSLIFGRNEFSLRLFPLLIGLVLLWMFYLLLKQVTSGATLWVGLALFAFNPRLIYYSSEVKQYIVDVAVTILLLLIATPQFQQPSQRRFAALAWVGSLALWFSHPSLFVLIGIGFALSLFYFRKRDFQNLRHTFVMGACWLVNLGILFTLTLNDLRHNSYMREYWQDAFVPMPPWSDLTWYVSAFQMNMDSQFGISFAAGVIFILMLAGLVILFFQHREVAVTLASILFFTLLASSLGLYPLLERMGLFLVPIGILMIAKSLEIPAKKLSQHPVPLAIVLFALSSFLLYGPITRSLEQFTTPKYFEHIRPTMSYLQESWKDGDVLFVSNGAIPAFEFYAPMYGMENISYTPGQREDYANPESILESAASLKSQHRVWILFSHVYEQGAFNERDYLIAYLDQIGEKRREFREPGTSVYLYLYDLAE